VAFDELLQQPGAHGGLLLRLTSPAQLTPLCHHVKRRIVAHRANRPLVVIPTPPDRSLWREVGLRLGEARLSGVAEEAAQQLASLLRERNAVVVGTLARGAVWDQSVTELLSRQLQGGLVVLVTYQGQEAPQGWVGSVFEIEEPLREDALRRWWSALCEGGLLRSLQESAATLDWLERGWGRALSEAVQVPDETPGCRVAELPADEGRLLVRLHLAGRAWPLQKLGVLGGDALVARRLQERGLVQAEEGGVFCTVHEIEAGDIDPQEPRAVGRALRQVFPGDPWASERAAGLLALGGQVAEAEEAHRAAILQAEDALASVDLWASWQAAVERLPEGERHGCSVRSAELALARGDADSAQSWAERAVALKPTEHRSQHLLGRALLGRGDLVGADVAFGRALATATTVQEQGAVKAARAEVRYAQGRVEEATALAQEAYRLASDAPCALDARNTLGKILLAQGQWARAEEHFAEDAAFAARLGDASAQLRARLNRAIAVMSSGRLHEARPMLEGVLAEGQEHADERATAFALSNLAVLAMNRHEYGEALRLSEQAINIRRRMGERLGLARIITNLAELRLRLGLLDEAQQTLSFGRLAVSRGGSIPRNAHFALIAARIHLTRGHTLLAARELTAALAGAAGSSDGDMLDECHRVGARIALEEGDVERARQELEQAEQHATTAYAHAEIALLQAQLLRATGAPSLEAAQHAAHLARRAGDEEFMREAHALAAQIARSEGNQEVSRSHLHQALALRDNVLAGLSEPLRRAFLSRRDLGVLSRLEHELNGPPSLSTPAAPPRSEPVVRASTRLLTGEDPAIRGLIEGIRKVGRTDATVLVLGESGTGKELVAEALHEASARSAAPLVRVNCGALVESLLLSELFGHEKGAFTGAVARKRGRFEMAEGGTLFLDEIGDISPATQVALLRVLQERTFERVGGTTPIRANVRIVCATHRDLRAMVERGEFRQDLYFRLSGIVLHVPALRARLGDLPQLARHLLQRIATERGEPTKDLSPEALALLMKHRWPGNVRELENALRAASLFADGSTIEASDLTEYVEALRPLASQNILPFPASSRFSDPPEPPPSVASEPEEDALLPLGAASDATETVYAELKAGKFGLFDIKRQLERDCIARALAETRGNITRAAAILGMKRPRLSQLVKQYGLAAVSSEGS
jgi:DNA-binding NtrC family response regulator/tetratricopeptide (TPR) repeat protein